MLLNIAKEAICSAVLLIIFCIIFAMKRHLIPADIIFYESFIVAFLYVLIIFLLSRLKNIMFGDLIKKSLYSSFLLIVLFNATIPTILDRSVSVTVIGSLKKSGTPLTIEQIRADFQQVYVVQQDAVNIRLKEQIASGNIQINDQGKFFLTNKGEVTSDIMMLVSSMFNVNKAYIDQ